jgi:hypothetical protein
MALAPTLARREDAEHEGLEGWRQVSDATHEARAAERQEDTVMGNTAIGVQPCSQR